MKTSMLGLALCATMASLLVLSVPGFATEMDDRIELSAKQSYVFGTYLKGDMVNIQSKGGNVTLTGSVSQESSKSLAQETVINLPGVKSVNNQLEVKGVIPATDAWLITKVKSTLLFHRNVNAAETEVQAKDGIVTLLGTASSTAQKDLTTEYTKDVEGVKSVKNEMTVTAAPKQPGETTLGQKIDTMGQRIGAMGESIDDASTTALVKTTLLYHRSTSALRTTVTTKDGLVTLGGKAKNDAEKDLASKLVSDVYGVNKVVNAMVVGP